jgi:Family of unknown function (DUF5684)
MTMIPALLLQSDDAAAAGAMAALFGFSAVMFLFALAIIAVFIAGLWKVFTKAGQPGWGAIVPIYNMYILTQIAGKPGWWVVLMLIPLVNIVIALLIAIDVAKAFGQSAAFGVILLFLLSGIGYLVLGFGNYRYLGPPSAAMAMA